MACKCFCGACQQQLHEHCSNVDKMLCTAPCGCCCTACKKSDHRNCSHMNECPEKQKAGLYDTNQARANAAAAAKDVQSLPMSPPAPVAPPVNPDDPAYDPWAGPTVHAAPPPPAPPAAVPAAPVAPLLSPESAPATPAQLAPPKAVLGSIFASPEAQAASREILAERAGAVAETNGHSPEPPRAASAPVAVDTAQPLEPAWRIASELASLEATLSMFEDEVSIKTASAARGKVLMELAQALAAVREVGVKAHEMAKMLERVRVAANALEGSQ